MCTAYMSDVHAEKCCSVDASLAVYEYGCFDSLPVTGFACIDIDLSTRPYDSPRGRAYRQPTLNMRNDCLGYACHSRRTVSHAFVFMNIAVSRRRFSHM
jgi:hypothetical protein